MLPNINQVTGKSKGVSLLSLFSHLWKNICFLNLFWGVASVQRDGNKRWSLTECLFLIRHFYKSRDPSSSYMETSPIRNPASPCWTKPLRPSRRRVEQLQRGLPGCWTRTLITPVVCKPYNIKKCFKLVGLTAQEHFNTLTYQLLDPVQRFYLSLFGMKMTQVKATHTCGWQGFPWLEKRGHCGPRVCVNVCVVPLCHTGRGWN